MAIWKARENNAQLELLLLMFIYDDCVVNNNWQFNEIARLLLRLLFSCFCGEWIITNQSLEASPNRERMQKLGNGWLKSYKIKWLISWLIDFAFTVITQRVDYCIIGIYNFK